jgi:hypothetical protein
VRWNIVPTLRDEMMDAKVGGRLRFTALAYRAYAPSFAKPLGPATIPGPLLQANVGDTLVVNFQNATPGPVTMHPHGVFYRPEMDGAYKGKDTDPGGFVQKGKTFQYVWDCHPDSVGYWPYHDHGPLSRTRSRSATSSGRAPSSTSTSASTSRGSGSVPTPSTR